AVRPEIPAQQRCRSFPGRPQKLDNECPFTLQGGGPFRRPGQPVEDGGLYLPPAGQHFFSYLWSIRCRRTLLAAFDVDSRGEGPLQDLAEGMEVIPRRPA